jgi:hypothetical protein
MSLLGPNDYSARVRAALAEIVHALGGLAPAAKCCGCTESQISESLKDTGADKNRFVRIEWVGALMNKAPRDLAFKLRCVLVGEGFDVIERKVGPEEELARLKGMLRARLGVTGESLIDEACR